jgi:hypothetical protein
MTTIIVHIGLRITDAIDVILEVKDELGENNEDEAVVEAVAMLKGTAALISMVEAHVHLSIGIAASKTTKKRTVESRKRPKKNKEREHLDGSPNMALRE